MKRKMRIDASLQKMGTSTAGQHREAVERAELDAANALAAFVEAKKRVVAARKVFGESTHLKDCVAALVHRVKRAPELAELLPLNYDSSGADPVARARSLVNVKEFTTVPADANSDRRAIAFASQLLSIALTDVEKSSASKSVSVAEANRLKKAARLAMVKANASANHIKRQAEIFIMENTEEDSEARLLLQPKRVRKTRPSADAPPVTPITAAPKAA